MHFVYWKKLSGICIYKAQPGKEITLFRIKYTTNTTNWYEIFGGHF